MKPEPTSYWPKDFLDSSSQLLAWPGSTKPRSIETMIAKMCAEFVRRESSDVDEAIHITLQQLLGINDASSCFIVEHNPDQTIGRLSYESLTPDFQSKKDELQNIFLKDYPNIMSDLRGGIPVVIDDFKELSETHDLYREHANGPARSIVIVPMFFGTVLIGTIGLSSEKPCIWQPHIIQLLAIVGEMIAGALEKKRVDQKLSARLRFEKFIAELGVKLIHFDGDQLESQMDHCISYIGEYLEADRCYLMRANIEEDRVYVTHEWTREGIDEVKDRLQEVPIRSNSFVSELLDKGEVVTIPNVDELPPEATGLKEMLTKIGTKSSAYFPMMHRGCWVGLLGIAYVRAPKTISQDDLSLLKLITQMVVNAHERKEMEDRLRASEQRFRLMLEAITDYGYDWNIATGEVYYTRRSENSNRRKRDEYTSHIETWLNSIHPEEKIRVQKILNEHLSGLTRFYEAEYRMKYAGDEEYRWVLDRGMVVDRNAKGEPIRFLGAELDIHNNKLIQDERERLIAELATKNHELEQFTYTVSHDLKSPLITISGFLGVLREDLKTGNMELINDAMNEIHEATIKMRHLLDQLLDLSRIGRVHGKIGPIPVKTLVGEALRAVDGSLRAKSIQLEASPLEGIIEGDQVRLQEVMQNLLENAVKFCSDKDGRIGISSRAENGEITLSISDNGIGIDPVYHEKVFGLFEKLDPQSEGTGIGLALCRRIIEHHDGKIWIESKGPGYGTTFHIRLKEATNSETP